MPRILVILAHPQLEHSRATGVVDAPTASFLVAAVTVSMLLTPLLLLGADRWWVPKLAKRAARAGRIGAARPAEISEPQNAPVIIAGFGRYGQIVGRLLNASGLSATVLEHDADQVETVRRFGWPVFYGDATRLDLLRTAGAASARVLVLVLAIDDVEQSLKVAALARAHFPQRHVVARARNVTHYDRLRQLGVSRIERETLDASLMGGRQVLELMGWQPHSARNQALRFRVHNIELLEQMAPHLGDEQKLIALSTQGRQQLERCGPRSAPSRPTAATGGAGGAGRPATRAARRPEANAVASSPPNRRQARVRGNCRISRPPGNAQTSEQASSNDRRGLRANTLAASPWPSVQMKLVLTAVPVQNAASSLVASKPLIGPQSSPSARAAMIR